MKDIYGMPAAGISFLTIGLIAFAFFLVFVLIMAVAEWGLGKTGAIFIWFALCMPIWLWFLVRLFIPAGFRIMIRNGRPRWFDYDDFSASMGLQIVAARLTRMWADLTWLWRVASMKGGRR
jgi:hypothetical protein